MPKGYHPLSRDQRCQISALQGRALDNVFIERLWRSVKYEEIYPKGYESMKEVRLGLKKYFEFYNNKRPHQGLDYRTPAEVYFGT